jgi:hypothetical protein
VPVIRNYGNALFDSLAQQGTPGGNPAKISPDTAARRSLTVRLKKGTVIAVLLVSTWNQKLVSINAAKQDGIGNRTVVCRDTGDLDLSLASDHDLDGRPAERQFSWLAGRVGNSIISHRKSRTTRMRHSNPRNIWTSSRDRPLCLRSRLPCKRWRTWARTTRLKLLGSSLSAVRRKPSCSARD